MQQTAGLPFGSYRIERVRKSAPLVRGSLALVVSEIVDKLGIFARSVILARILGPYDFGVASTFMISVAAFDMVSGFSPDLLLIQNQDGKNLDLQRSMHAFQAIRGMVTGLLIFLFSGWIAEFFGISEAQWTFQILAIVPVIVGLGHLDIKRFQRKMNFTPAAQVVVGTALLVTALAWPAATFFESYSAVLCLLVVQAAIITLASHLVAEHRYSWAFSTQSFKKILSFGWPLVLNGILIFGFFQGDRVIIAGFEQYSLSDLGVYSIAFTLAMAPTLFLGKIVSALLLPLLSQAQGVRDLFNRRYLLCNQLLAVIGSLFGIVLIVTGGWIIEIVYGGKYLAAAEFIGWLSATHILRTLRLSPTVAAIASGDTRAPMIANTGRSFALVLALLGAWSGYGLVWIAFSSFVGELIALALILVRLNRRIHLEMSLFLKSAAACGIVIAVCMMVEWFGVPTQLWAALTVPALLIVGTLAGMLWLFAEFRAVCADLVTDAKSWFFEET